MYKIEFFSLATITVAAPPFVVAALPTVIELAAAAIASAIALVVAVGVVSAITTVRVVD